MTQVWLHIPDRHYGGQGEMHVRADYITALYETRDAHTPLGTGRPWRIEASVVGLARPVVLLTAPDRPEGEREEPAFLGALPELRDVLAEQMERIHPGVDIVCGTFREYQDDRRLIDWEEHPDPPRRSGIRGL